MAENSSLVSRQCVAWRTERSYIKRLRVSPSFNFQNSSWSLSISFSEKNEYYIKLKSQSNRQLFHTFDVTTYLESLTGRSVLSQTVTVTQTPHVIWSSHESDVLENLPALKDYSEFTVVCVFRCFGDHSEANVEGDQEFRTNGYLTNTISNADFHEEKLPESSTKYSHCVSWKLLIGTFLCFVIIGTLYMTEVQKFSQTANKNYLRFCGDIPEEICKMLILVTMELHKLLTTVAGQYDCDTSGLIKNRNLTYAEAKSRLYEQLSDKSIQEDEFAHFFYTTLKLILKNPEFGIKWYSTSESELKLTDIYDSSKIDSSVLEATQAAKSLWCRVRPYLQWTTSRLLLLVIFMAFCSYVLVNIWKKLREALKRLICEIVEKNMEILHEPQDSSYQYDSHLGPRESVVNNTDALILPKERKDNLWLWDKVVAFIEENEPRLSVEYKKINGEDFKLWRWHPSSSAESEGGKQGKVWQSQASNSLVKRKNATHSPTPCLKIRNMFDPEVEYGDDWQVNIQNAILGKCEGNDGIRHIASTEGCVYMLCNSSEAAGKAFDALHGWWFHGKLVTVKYIRYERYLERFPAAENCVEPLKLSNNMRLSLSTPFFASALERSGKN